SSAPISSWAADPTARRDDECPPAPVAGTRRTRRHHVAARSGRQAQARGAGRPRAVPAAIVAHLGRDRDLFGLAGLVRHTGAAVGLPGLQVELQTAVVAVAGVDRPVTAGLALGQVVPHAGVAAVVVVTGTAAAAGVIVTGAAVVTRA